MKELTLAEKLRLLRGTETQKDAAARAGIPPATLCKLERAQRGVSTRREAVAQRQATLAKLAAAYGVLPEYLTADLPTYISEFTRRLPHQERATAGLRVRAVLDEVRLRYGLSAEDLEEPLGLSAGDLEAICEDRLMLTPSVLERFEQVLGVPSQWVRYGPSLMSGNPLDVYRRGLELAAGGGMPPAELEKLVTDWLTRTHGRKV